MPVYEYINKWMDSGMTAILGIGGEEKALIRRYQNSKRRNIIYGESTLFPPLPSTHYQCYPELILLKINEMRKEKRMSEGSLTPII